MWSNFYSLLSIQEKYLTKVSVHLNQVFSRRFLNKNMKASVGVYVYAKYVLKNAIKTALTIICFNTKLVKQEKWAESSIHPWHRWSNSPLLSMDVTASDFSGHPSYSWSSSVLLNGTRGENLRVSELLKHASNLVPWQSTWSLTATAPGDGFRNTLWNVRPLMRLIAGENFMHFVPVRFCNLRKLLPPVQRSWLADKFFKIFFKFA
jgi:hypothetical protein